MTEQPGRYRRITAAAEAPIAPSSKQPCPSSHAAPSVKHVVAATSKQRLSKHDVATSPSNFYKKLFGAPIENYVSLNEEMVEDIAQLGDDENEVLIAPLTENEVFKAIMQMKNNKAPVQIAFQLNFIRGVGI